MEVRPRLRPVSEEEKNEDGSAKEEYFEKVHPLGYRFEPTDDELIKHYLMIKVNDQELPPHKIRSANVYEHSPQEITGKYRLYRESEWFFFTTRNRKYPNGSRPDRAAGAGFWKPTGTTVKILVDGVGVAERRSLDYYAGSHNDSHRTAWKMHEYVITQSNIPLNTRRNSNTSQTERRLNDCILCKIYKSDRKNRRNGADGIEAQEVPDDELILPVSYSQHIYNGILRNDADGMEPQQVPNDELILPVLYSQHTDYGIARLDASNSLPASAWEMGHRTSLAAGSSSIFSETTVTGTYNNGTSLSEPLMSYGSSGSLEDVVNQFLTNPLPAGEDVHFFF